MRKPVVDYGQFRLSKLKDPQYSHLLFLIGWIVYFILYALTERLIPVQNCYPVHMWLDDRIVFNEWFVIPYVFWYFLIMGSMVWFALYAPDGFRKLMIFIIVTQVVAVLIYILFPTRQDLRPEEFLRDNILTRTVGVIYTLDTNTGVCPSLHVCISIAIASAWMKEKQVGRGRKVFVVIAAILICMSTCFIKQHSAVDFFAALPVCVLAEGIAYGKSFWVPRFKLPERKYQE